MDILIGLVVVAGAIVGVVAWMNEDDRKTKEKAEFTATMTEFRRALAAGENPPAEVRHHTADVQVNDPGELNAAIQRTINETIRDTYFDAGASVSVVTPTSAIIHFHGSFPPGV